MATGHLLLLDDIASILDDVAKLTKVSYCLDNGVIFSRNVTLPR